MKNIKKQFENHSDVCYIVVTDGNANRSYLIAYHDITYRIHKDHSLYDWADGFAHSENNMRNVALFHIRNLNTGLHKAPSERHQLEQEVIDKFVQVHAQVPNPKWESPTADAWIPNRNALDDVFKYTKNPDYYAENYCVKTAQNSFVQVIQNMFDFLAECKSYAENPDKFTGIPNMPKYKRKGGVSTFTVDNQDGHVIYDQRGRQFLKLPKTKTRMPLGRFIPADWTLKQIKVKPDGTDYVMHVIFDDGSDYPEPEGQPTRIAAGDMGVDNIIACVNNVGGKSLIVKGGVAKSVNQYRNKRMAEIQSEQTKGGDEKFKMTDEAWAIEHYRADKLRDFFFKVANLVRDWCVDNRIDTFVLGYNRDWKEDVKMNHENKQAFIQIPFAKFAACLTNVLERVGIRVVEQEESYTSQASLLDLDDIPNFGDKEPEGGWGFHGYRYGRGRYKLKGRKIYVNADLNGAGNILRKAFPWAFDEGRGVLPELCDRSAVIVVKHPDLGEYVPGTQKKKPSLSKARRIARKTGLVDERGCARLDDLAIEFSKRSPTGIELTVIA